MDDLATLFADSFRVGDDGEITDSFDGFAEAEVEFPRSPAPRGLALRSLTITKQADGFWGWLRKRQQVYFMTVATDLSGRPPQVMPPEPVAADVVHEVRPDQELTFTLGEGAPLFFPRTIVGGLAVYVVISEADRGVRHIGETMKKVHEDLTADEGSFVKTMTKLVTNPAQTLADEALAAVSAALRPIGTILAAQQDDHIGAVSGIFRADTPWAGKLEQSWVGGRIELAEL